MSTSEQTLESANNGWFSLPRFALSAVLLVPLSVLTSVVWLRWSPTVDLDGRQEELRRLTGLLHTRFGQDVAGWLLTCPMLLMSVGVAAAIVLPWSLSLLTLARPVTRPLSTRCMIRELVRDLTNLSCALALTHLIALTTLALSPESLLDTEAVSWSASLLLRTLLLCIPYVALLTGVRAVFGARKWVALLAYILGLGTWTAIDATLTIVRPGGERWLPTQLFSEVMVLSTKQASLGALTCCAWGAACLLITIVSVRLVEMSRAYRQKVLLHANHV